MGIRRWLNRWLNGVGEGCIPVGCETSHDYDLGEPSRFTVYPANGGLVVRVCKWDDKRDDTVTTLHVLSQKDNYAGEIYSIISMEALKY